MPKIRNPKSAIRNRDAAQSPPLQSGGVNPMFSPAAPSSLAHGLNLGTVISANHWREYYNPLPALDLQRARALYDFSRRGLNAELQNVYREMEELHPTLFALLERRNAALQEMDITIKVIEEAKLPPGCTKSMASAQAEVLQAAYDGIDNMGEAVEWMELAAFRKYSHLEKIYASPGSSDLTIAHLEPVEQWHWTRKSQYSEWEYVAAATQSNTGVPINYDQFVIRDCKRHLDRLALIQYIRASLCEKDWDAFIEIYGIPSWIVIMPPNIPPDKAGEYRAAALEIARGGSGALPNGSDAKAGTRADGKDVFRPRLDWLQEQLVLAGTCGLLSMLSMPTGMNSTQGDVHEEAFAKLGKRSAKQISEVFNKQLDAPILDRDFPGVPHLASFWLASEEQTDPTAFVADVAALFTAGYQVDPEQITVKTGYKVTLKPEPEKPETGNLKPENEKTPVANRAPDDSHNSHSSQASHLESSGADALAAAVHDDMSHVAARLAAILQISDPDLMRKKAQAFLDDYPQLLTDTLLDPESARALAGITSAALATGLSTESTSLTNRDDDGSQPRDESGKWSSSGVAPGHIKLTGSKLVRETDKTVLAKVRLQEGSHELWLPKSHASIDSQGTVHASPWIIDGKHRDFDQGYNPELLGEKIQTGDEPPPLTIA